MRRCSFGQPAKANLQQLVPPANADIEATGQSRRGPEPVEPLPRLTVFARHLGCLLLPSGVLAFVATGPHRPAIILLTFLALFVVFVLDYRAGPASRRPIAAGPDWPFRLVVGVLSAIQFGVLALLLRSARVHGFSLDLVLGVWLVGANSGWATLVVAHELVHSRNRAAQLLGRVLLSTVLYEHFFTEHVRGHHRRVATAEDTATARFGETLRAFQRRTIVAQWRSAVAIEACRLGDEHMSLWDRRQLHNRVLRGAVAQLGLLGAITLGLGPLAGLAFLYQAVMAIDLLETVNYFEHWGLVRRSKQVGPNDSWDAESWFSVYTLVGLARHADHHAHATRPFFTLSHHDESPKLPCGYYAMILLAHFANARFRALMTAELRRCGRLPDVAERVDHHELGHRPEYAPVPVAFG